VPLAIGDARSPLPAEQAVLLGGGIALFLVGNVGFRAALGIRPLRYRVVGALLALATSALGVTISGFAQLLALLATVVVLFALETAHRD
jgi:hypothetical protein